MDQLNYIPLLDGVAWLKIIDGPQVGDVKSCKRGEDLEAHVEYTQGFNGDDLCTWNFLKKDKTKINFALIEAFCKTFWTILNFKFILGVSWPFYVEFFSQSINPMF